jgi:hypothetical protein
MPAAGSMPNNRRHRVPRRRAYNKAEKMTEFVIKLKDESKVDLFIAMLKRLVTAEGVDLSVERNGQGVGLDTASDDDARFEAMVNRIIEDAIAGKIERLTPEQEEAEERELAAYGEQKAQESGITSDDDIVRIVNEYRREQKEKVAA